MKLRFRLFLDDLRFVLRPVCWIVGHDQSDFAHRGIFLCFRCGKEKESGDVT